MTGRLAPPNGATVTPPELRVLAQPLFGGAFPAGKRVLVYGRQNGFVYVRADGGEAKFPETYLVPVRPKLVVSV